VLCLKNIIVRGSISIVTSFFPDVKICNVETTYQHFEQLAASFSVGEDMQKMFW
jgi:hypothetical protein